MYYVGCRYSGVRKVMFDVFVTLIKYVYLIMHEKYIGIGKKFRKLLSTIVVWYSM